MRRFRILAVLLIILITTISTICTATEITASITAQNQWTTTPIRPNPNNGKFYIGIEGTGWAATVTLQKSYDSGTTWHNVLTWTANIQTKGEDDFLGIVYRIGVATGQYTSGTISVRLTSNSLSFN